MYPIALGTAFMVQQTISGTGVFDGSEFGRAKCQIPAITVANATVRLSAALYGTTANALTVMFLDTGAGTTVAATTVALIGSQLTVTLRRNPGGLLATAQEVAAAINAFGGPIRAVFDGNGTGVASATLSPMPLNNVVSGEDPAFGPSLPGLLSDQFKWARPVNTNAGFFYFEQQDVVIIRQIESVFTLGGNNHVFFKRVNLNSNLEPLSSESITFFEADISVAEPGISVSDVRILLHPFQAIQVITQAGGAPGTVRIDIRREANFPYL